ncbi:MAG TPA: DUF2971 domain-containing protein [Pelobium sp.]|nr:DUF2971 domain-containing protein [Pelobium sp.]
MRELILVGDDKIEIKLTDGLLYKYFCIDKKLKKSIRNNYLWFSDPLKDFNDPYDCNTECGIGCSEGEIYEFIKKKSSNEKLGLDEDWIRNRAKRLFSNPIESQELAKEGDLQTIAQLGVCCFSKEDDILLLWSHYADKHKGVCLVFDVLNDKELFGKYPYQVEYPKEYPIYNYPCDEGTFNSYRFLVATKSKDWEYEKEVRLIRDSENKPFRGAVKFAKEALVAVKFGYKSELSEMTEVNKWLIESGGYEHVKFYSANLKKLAFGLEFEEISRTRFH